jgi:hypothetical protein
MSQYVAFLAILAYHTKKLNHPKIKIGLYFGKDADEHLDNFKNGDLNVIFMSSKRGALGLNIPEASGVFHSEQHWNRNVLDQGEGRAHRMGQTKVVKVKEFITAASAEVWKLAKSLAKAQHSRAWLDGKPTPLERKVTEEDLIDLYEMHVKLEELEGIEDDDDEEEEDEEEFILSQKKKVEDMDDKIFRFTKEFTKELDSIASEDAPEAEKGSIEYSDIMKEMFDDYYDDVYTQLSKELATLDSEDESSLLEDEFFNDILNGKMDEPVEDDDSYIPEPKREETERERLDRALKKFSKFDFD